MLPAIDDKVGINSGLFIQYPSLFVDQKCLMTGYHLLEYTL